MSLPWLPQNPGIDLIQFTDAEVLTIQNISGLGDPNADRILFWDDSAGAFAYLTIGSGLNISGTTITASGGGSGTFIGLTDVPSSYTGSALKFLRVNAGETALEFATISGGGDALTSNPLSQFASTTSSQLAGVISDETGSGSLVFATSPTLVTPTLGVATATSINKVAITAPATSATLTIANGATLTASANATVSGTNTGDQTDITGNAGTVTVVDAGGDTTTFPMLATSATGNLAPATDAGLTYNATTNALTTSTFIGALTGNASTATALQTGRAINGVTFDGTSAITVTAAAGTLTGTTLNATVVSSSLTSVGTIATGVWNGTTVGVAYGGTGKTSWTQYLIPYADTTTSFSQIAIGTSGQVLTSNGAGSAPSFQDPIGGGGTGSSTTKAINQTSHGFSVNDVVKFSGTTYQKAKADSAANAEVIGVVTAVADVDNFTITTEGYVSTLSSLTSDTVYFLSDATAGLLTATEPSSVGSISKPILKTVSTTTGYVFNWRGAQITSGSVTTTGTQTLSNKRIVPRVTTITSSATPTINTDNCDAVTITALATAITSMTTNLSGTPNNFDKLIIRIKDDGTARAITWGTSFEAKGVALPTTTVISKVLTVGFIYDTVTSKWGCVASAQEA